MFWNKTNSQKMLFHKEAIDEMKKDYSLVDMHVHSEYSHDSKSRIEMLMRRAQKLGIGLAITDHKRAEGSLKAYNIAKKYRTIIVPGIEVASRENKDILLYFYSAKDLRDYYEKYLKGKSRSYRSPNNGLTKSLTAVKSSLSMNKIVELANGYSCLKSIAHPYTYLNKSSYIFFAKKRQRPAMKSIDAVEVINSSLNARMNKRSRSWAIRRNRAFTAGSDAHRTSDIGTALVACRADSVEEFLDSIKQKKNLVLGKEIGVKAAFKSIIYSNKTKCQKKWKP